jgi:hypothetical protein
MDCHRKRCIVNVQCACPSAWRLVFPEAFGTAKLAPVIRVQSAVDAVFVPGSIAVLGNLNFVWRDRRGRHLWYRRTGRTGRSRPGLLRAPAVGTSDVALGEPLAAHRRVPHVGNDAITAPTVTREPLEPAGVMRLGTGMKHPRTFRVRKDDSQRHQESSHNRTDTQKHRKWHRWMGESESRIFRSSSSNVKQTV